jgi:hypothetical protein
MLGDWNVLELKIRDGAPVRAARAVLRQHEAELLVRLNDGGLEGDRSAGDGIFTGLVPNVAPGAYRVTLAAEDELGNSARTELEDHIVIAPAPPR